MKRTVIAALSMAMATVAAYSQEPCEPAQCIADNYCPTAPSCGYVPENCYDEQGCMYTDCDQQPLLDCYSTLANKYSSLGEAGRRAALAQGNTEVGTLYALHNHFRSHIGRGKLNDDQLLQLQAVEGCMGE